MSSYPIADINGTMHDRWQHGAKPSTPAGKDHQPPAIIFPASAQTAESIALSSIAVTIIIAAFLLSSDAFYHWFLLPVAFCGIILGADAVAWIRGHLSLYDPVGIIGLFGFHFFFLAPLLHVQWDLWMFEVNAPPDWRDWLGYMGILNATGILCYRAARHVVESRTITAPHRTYWQLNQRRFRVITPLLLVTSAVAQMWIYAHSGGIMNFMQTSFENPDAFEGMGWVFMIGESVPILTTFLVIFYLQRRRLNASKLAITLLGLFVVQMLFAGLRGSRSQTIMFLFWAVGCIHFLHRPVSRKLIYAGSGFVLAFVYFYLFYKVGGINGFNQAMSGSAEREYLSQKSGRTFRGALLGDLGRADVQAFLLYRVVNDPRDLTYANGRTYLGALSLLIPSAIFPNRPDPKLKEGTDIQAGPGEYVPKVHWSSRVYGLAGEGMLNFGPTAVPISYLLFGLLVASVRRYIFRLPDRDLRFLLVPFAIYECFGLLLGDSDNVVFGLIKDGFIPFLVVFLCSTRMKRKLLYAPSPALDNPTLLTLPVTLTRRALDTFS